MVNVTSTPAQQFSSIAQTIGTLVKSHNDFAISLSAPRALPDQLKILLSEGTLSDQKDRCSDATVKDVKDHIVDLQIDLSRATNKLSNHRLFADGSLVARLCDYIVAPDRNQEERFFARELLHHCPFSTGMTPSVRNYCSLAEHLEALKAPLKLGPGENLLDEVSTLTKVPQLWIALVDNLVSGKLRGTNKEHLIPMLRQNRLSGDTQEESAEIAAKIAELKEARDRWHILSDAQKMQAPPAQRNPAEIYDLLHKTSLTDLAAPPAHEPPGDLF